MAHDSWNMNHPEIENSYDPEIKKVFQYIKSSLTTIFNFVTDKKDQLDLETFSDDLPTFEDIQEKEKIIQKEVIFENSELPPVNPPPPPSPSQRKMVKEIKIDGAIIVSTPQDVALLDVKRGIKMFDKLNVKILGLVDNMSYFVGDDGKKYNIFGDGGVKKTAEEFKKEFLGEIPIDIQLGRSSDAGKPIVEEMPDHKISKIYTEIAKKIKIIITKNF